MRTAGVVLSLVLPLAGLAAPAPAAAAEPGQVVRVTAVVSDGDGGISLVSRPAASLRAGHDLARRWDAQPGVRAAAVAQPVRAASDPFRADQWGLTRLAAEQAWLPGPATGQVVAVVDTGVDAAHPDLAGALTTGTDLLGGVAGTDPNGHGTHVAGIIAAVADGVGVAGLAQGAKVMPVRVLDADGAGYDDDVARGIVWAVDHGADVVNLSLGGDSASPVLTAAVQHALAHEVVVVAAAGNAALDGDPVLYPAATPGVLAVGATGSDDAHAAFSSTGAHLGLAAPGVSVLSTWPGARWAWSSGTSMAAPFVAAAAAMVRADAPALGQAAVRGLLTSTADDLGAPGPDPLHGAGLLDVVGARAAARALAVVAPVTEVVAPVVEPVLTPVVQIVAPLLPAPSPSVAPAPVEPSPAPAPVGTVVPVPAPAPVAAPVAWTARISRSAAVVLPGGAVTLATRVLADGVGRSGVPVVLERRVGAGAWYALRSGTTGTGGLASWVLRPDRTGEHRVRATGVLTPGLVVQVRQLVAVTAVARSGAYAVVTGTVRPTGVGPVWLQVRSGTAWLTVAKGSTTADGRTRLTARVVRGAAVRLHSPARPALLAGTSAARTA